MVNKKAAEEQLLGTGANASERQTSAFTSPIPTQDNEESQNQDAPDGGQTLSDALGLEDKLFPVSFFKRYSYTTWRVTLIDSSRNSEEKRQDSRPVLCDRRLSPLFTTSVAPEPTVRLPTASFLMINPSM